MVLLFLPVVVTVMFPRVEAWLGVPQVVPGQYPPWVFLVLGRRRFVGSDLSRCRRVGGGRELGGQGDVVLDGFLSAVEKNFLFWFVLSACKDAVDLPCGAGNGSPEVPLEHARRRGHSLVPRVSTFSLAVAVGAP